MKISISNLNKRYGLNEAFIKKIAAHVLRYIGKSSGLELEVVFLNDRAMRAMNRKYLRANRATDVLSFRIGQKEFGKNDFLGEVFISLDSARSNSTKFKTDFSEEVVLYIIHGILHLAGHKDYKQTDRVRMWRRQNRVLRYLYTKEDLSRVLTRR